MKIKSVAISNFRAFKDEVVVQFDDMTTFVGRNDIGKTAIMDAMDIYFNDGAGSVKLDKNDINCQNAAEGNTTICITVEFCELPNQIVIDAQNATTLSQEYLLTQDGTLKICKEYPNAGKAKVSIIANHPTNPQCSDLLLKKISELKKILDEQNIECEDRTRSAVIRKAIWQHYEQDLGLREVPIDVSKEGAKDIYAELDKYLPMYALFHADRSNNDTDSEIQDPMKIAVKQILRKPNVAQLCQQIASEVTNELSRVASETMDKLAELNTGVAQSLTPNIPPIESLKWNDVFKSVSINSDNEIPLNKRGSGVKRLVLISFFRAEVERRKNEAENNGRGIIYAIEEPETAQHVKMQKAMIEALIALSSQPNVQVIVTTHSSFLVKQLQYSNIRLIYDDNGTRRVKLPTDQLLPYASLNEINFTAFEDYSVEYHDELYGDIQMHATMQNQNCASEGPFEQWLATKGVSRPKNWIREEKNGNLKTYPVTLETYIRNYIHHRENQHNPHYTYEELAASIDEMRWIIQNGY